MESEASGLLSDGKQIYVWGGGQEHKTLISGFSGKEYKAPRSLALCRQQLPFNTANSLTSCSGNSTIAFNYIVKAGERGNRLRRIEKGRQERQNAERTKRRKTVKKKRKSSPGTFLTSYCPDNAAVMVRKKTQHVCSQTHDEVKHWGGEPITQLKL